MDSGQWINMGCFLWDHLLHKFASIKLYCLRIELQMSIRLENKEIHRQNLVKDAFRQLLNRLNATKISPPRHDRSKIIKQKSNQYEKCKRYSAGFKFKPKQLTTQPINTRNNSLVSSFSNTPTNYSQTCFSNWHKKDGVSSRCKTQTRNKTVHSIHKRPQQNNNPLLIAKSFTFQELQPRKTEYMPQNKGKKRRGEVQNEFNLTDEHFRYKKNYRRDQHRMFNFRKAMKKRQDESSYFIKKDMNLQYQPWQTEHQNDSF